MLKSNQSLSISNDLLFMNKELENKKEDIREQGEVYLNCLKEENVWITHKYINRVRNILEQVLNQENSEKIDNVAYNNDKIFELIVRILRYTIKGKTLKIIGNFKQIDSRISGNTIIEYSDVGEKSENTNLDLPQNEVIKKDKIKKVIENIINPITHRLEYISDNVTEFKEKFKISFNYSTFKEKFKRGFFNINKILDNLSSANQIKKSYLETNMKRIEENEQNMVNAAKGPLQFYIRYLNTKVNKILNPKINLGTAVFEGKHIELTPTAVSNYLFSSNILTSMDFQKFTQWINKLAESFRINNSINNSRENEIIIIK